MYIYIYIRIYTYLSQLLPLSPSLSLSLPLSLPPSLSLTSETAGCYTRCIFTHDYGNGLGPDSIMPSR